MEKNKPTPEEIMNKHGIITTMDGNDYMRFGCTLNKIKSAMQEYAEEFHKSKLKEELITYDKWKYDNSYLIMIHDKSEEQIINEYLKQKE